MTSSVKQLATLQLERLFHIRFDRLLIAHLALFFTLCVGLAFRLHGIGFGLPYIYGFGELAVVQSGYQLQRAGFGTDEPQIVHSSLRILAKRTLNPEYFDYPGTPLIYMGAALYLAIFLFGSLSGFFQSADDFEAILIHNPTLFYLSGRLLVVFLSILTLVMVYLIAKRMFSRTGGLIAAAILAISPLHVALSKLFRVDVLMVLFLLVAFWFCLDILQKRTWSSYVLAGLFTGLAAMTKYPGIVFAITIVLAHIAAGSRSWQDHRKLVAAGFATVVGAFIGSPHAFLELQSVLTSLRDEASAHLGGNGEGLFLNLIWYLREAFPVSISIAGLILAVVGLVLCLRSRHKDRLNLLSFPVVFLVFISLLNLRWERWILPVVPFFILWITYALISVQAWISKRANALAGMVTAALLIALICIPLAQLNLLHGQILTGEDTRTQAREWMLENIPAGSRVLMELDTPQTPIVWFQYYGVDKHYSLTPVNLAHQRHDDIIMPGRLGWLGDVGEVKRQGIDYIVISDYFERYRAESHIYPKEVATYEQLIALGDLIHEIAPQPGLNQGPHLQIYRIKADT